MPGATLRATPPAAHRQKRNGPARMAGPLRTDARRLLAGVAELVRHVRERVLQLAAQGIHGREDRDGNAGRDEAVFDRGGATLVTQETLEHRHVALPRLSAESRRHSTGYEGTTHKDL